MINKMYSQLLYDALDKLLEATCYADVQEVGGEPLQIAWDEADALQKKIDATPDLLAACKVARDALRDTRAFLEVVLDAHPTHITPVSEVIEALKQARAAIAAAEGEA